MSNKVLYVGSGNSALLAKNKDLSEYSSVVCVNNAWRIFEESTFNYWIHSGDFPKENYPKEKNYEFEISTLDYNTSTKNIIKKLSIKTKYPEHFLGYTIFFQGLYWILDNLNVNEIHLLGFDHDYNQKKVDKWINSDKPNPQNHFLKNKNQSIKDWSETFFKDYEQDFFYGHGTPDPIRLGVGHLIEKFSLLKENTIKLGVKLYNVSPVKSNINTIQKIEVNTFFGDDYDNLKKKVVFCENELNVLNGKSIKSLINRTLINSVPPPPIQKTNNTTKIVVNRTNDNYETKKSLNLSVLRRIKGR